MLSVELGMIIIGVLFTAIGFIFTIKTLLKGKIVAISLSGKVIFQEKIMSIFPLRISYFYALAYTLSFGPGALIIGVIGLITFVDTLVP